MHSCLHDWPDSKAHDILMSLNPGLKKGYSKLLINENVIPDQGTHWLSTALDMVMMANYSSRAHRAELACAARICWFQDHQNLDL